MNTNIIQVIPAPDALMDRYNELAFTIDIPDMHEYAMNWQRLGNDCAKQDRPALAEMAYQRAKHYAEYGGGYYYRIVDGCLADVRTPDRAPE